MTDFSECLSSQPQEKAPWLSSILFLDFHSRAMTFCVAGFEVSVNVIILSRASALFQMTLKWV